MKSISDNITPVTKTFLPPISEYITYLQRVYKNNWLSNRGELVLELEKKLKEFLKVNHILLTNNGTIPLQIALKLLGEEGEVLTTPFSYVATTAAIVWENCTPVFVDIHPDYLTIDETKIEDYITPRTRAILATHVYGNPCNVEVIKEVANRHNLSIIYDAAHCFGVWYRNKSIFEYGNISTCSFHATKIFHTAEGGAIFANDEELQHKIYYTHNFGHKGPLEFEGLGINAKISELQAAMGLAVLPYIENIINSRKKIVAYYDDQLNFRKLKRIKIREGTQWNYSYYPIIFEHENQLLKVQEVLNSHNIIPRRYFYPSLNNLPYVKKVMMPIAESVASRVLCLPLYVDLSEKKLDQIVSLVNQYV